MLKTNNEEISEFKVALVGRPNVGKSSLFNTLTETRDALVKNIPGVTRDFRAGRASWWGKEFDIVDTGGWTESQDIISQRIKSTLEERLKNFDLLLFICDIKEGLTSDDRNFFEVVRDSGVPFLVVLNKCDNLNAEEYDFYSLGVEKFIKISCEHKIGIDVLIDEVFSFLPEVTTTKEEEFEAQSEVEELVKKIEICTIGRPNVGKSSLVNKILNKEQQLVSPISGTTTDSLRFEGSRGEFNFGVYDTAGVRRKARLDGGLEGLMVLKGLETIEKSDFALIVLDGTEPPTRSEARLIEKCAELSKPFLLVINKWDIAPNQDEVDKNTYKEALIKEFHFLKTIEMVFISAKTGMGIDKLFSKLQFLKEKLSKRISTGELNRFFTKVIKMTPTPFYHNKQVKLYYITQTRQVPPSFLCYVNYPKGITPAYKRFLINRITEEWDLHGVPVRIFFMPKNGKSLEARSGAPRSSGFKEQR